MKIKITKEKAKYIVLVLILAAALFTIAGMILGPIEYNSLSLFFSCAACVLAISGIVISLFFWKK